MNFKVIPVTGYDDLSRENEKLISTNENVSLAIFVEMNILVIL